VGRSALLKLYVREPGTETMLRLAAAPQHRIAVSGLAAVEFRCAVRRRERAGDIPAATARALLDRLQRHLVTAFLQQPLNDSVLGLAANLADRHPLRALDAVQLAACLALRENSEPPLVFVCSDGVLLTAAADEGLRWLNPMHG